jgi:FkbM family methyltransferase
MGTIQKLLKKDGLNGLITYTKIKTGNTSRIKIPGTGNSVTLRKNTTDIAVFKHVFIREEYKFKTELKPKFIIDAGANIGLSSIYFSNQFPEARILSIEAEKENFTILVKNTEGYPGIIPLNAGLWDKTVTLEVVNPGYEATGFMVKETSESNPNGFKAISVNEIISEYQLSEIDLIKLDIEGAEKELLTNNTEWISCTGAIIIELHDRKKEGCSKAFLEAFGKHNFECYPFGQNFLLINKDI